jgi:hypothetical protein
MSMLLGAALLAPAALPQEEAVLVRVIETSQFSPPSPDPAGIAYLPSTGELLISDSEVNEMSIFAGVNLFSVSIAGSLVGGASSLGFSDEPTGLALNALNGHLFVSDDDADRVSEVDPGSDGIHGTGDDIVTFIETSVFGCNDAEGVAYDPVHNELFVISGAQRLVFRVSAGSNGVFDGVSPGGDDTVLMFDVGVYGLQDPEGITFSAGSGTLYIFDAKSDQIIELTPSGTLVRSISVLQAGLNGGAGLAIGPASNAPGQWNFYVVRRGVDNNSDPNENDGLLFELSVSGLVAGDNLPPFVSAGADATVGILNGAVLDGTVIDDGMPVPPGSVTVGWSKVGGPGAVTFADPASVDTTADFSTTGQYVLRLSADDGEFTTQDDVVLDVVEGSVFLVESRVSADHDDAEEDALGAVSLNSSDLELVDASTLQTVGMRFTSVEIPKGSFIQSAVIQFQTDELDSEPTSLTLQGQAADDALTFTAALGDISSRPRTAAAVAWSPPPWLSLGETGPDQRTTDLAPILQEIVDRPGWSSGNALVIIVTGTGKRVAESFNGDALGAPLLVVQYGGDTGSNTAPLVYAGLDLTISLENAALLDGMVSDDGLPDPPGAVTTTWSQVSGPGTATFGNPGTVDTSATFSAPGTYVLRLDADDGDLSASDETTVTVIPTNTPPVVDAGADQAVELSMGATLDGTVSDDGLPDPPGAVAITWSQVSGPGVVGFADASAEDTTATFSLPGSYVVRLTADDGDLTASDDLAITVSPPNQAPTVDAGADQAIELPAGAALDGTVGDDGLPDPPGAVTVTWSKANGPGPVSFADANAVDTTASFSNPGTYVLRLLADDGALTASDEVTITVAPANQAPTADAGADQAIELPAGATLDGSVGDDGLPDPPGVLTTTWSQVSGPGTAAFGDASAVDTLASFPVAGTYVLRLTADDGALAASDDTTISVSPPNVAPTVDVGEDLTVGLGAGASLSASVGDDGLPNPPATLVTTWSQVSGPGTVGFGDAAATDTSASFSEVGVYVLRLTADDGALSAQDDLTVTVVPDTFVDLGGASQGVGGPPNLRAVGPLIVGSTLVVDLENAAPDAAMYVWLSITSIPIDVLGGTVHTNPIALQVLRVTDAGGAWSDSVVWPDGFPPGTDLYLQAAIQDASAQNGIALSNAVTSEVP